jgi:hypothetical protein
MKPSFTLTIVALLAWLGPQADASARNTSFPPPLTIPPAHGSISLVACDMSEDNICPAKNISVQFPSRSPPSATVTNAASSATGMISNQPSPPSISATINATAQSQAKVLFVYYFALTSKPGTILLNPHIAFTASGKTSGTGDALAYVDVQVQQLGSPLGSLFSDYACIAPCLDSLPVKQTFSDSKELQVYGNTVYSVVLSVDLAVDGVTGMTGSAAASGSVDPIITIDPAYADDFQLLLSRSVSDLRHGRAGKSRSARRSTLAR